MEQSRRRFLKIAGVSALTLIAPGTFPRVAATDGIPGAAAQSSGILTPARALTAKRWAMAIDPSRCRPGCTDCIQACHAVHNVPDFGNPKDEIKWIWRDDFAHVFPSERPPHLANLTGQLRPPVLCNHCANPPCVRVCPTQATFQRPDGIVMMDYHRCIGCRFCMAACPYGARSMNFRDPRPCIAKLNPDFPTRTRGVVEKCNFCEERLARGKLPACVEACAAKALIFGDVEDPQSELRTVLAHRFALRRRAGLGTEPQVFYLL